jgi:hypothetical protein
LEEGTEMYPPTDGAFLLVASSVAFLGLGGFRDRAQSRGVQDAAHRRE